MTAIISLGLLAVVLIIATLIGLAAIPARERDLREARRGTRSARSERAERASLDKLRGTPAWKPVTPAATADDPPWAVYLGEPTTGEIGERHAGPRWCHCAYAKDAPHDPAGHDAVASVLGDREDVPDVTGVIPAWVVRALSEGDSCLDSIVSKVRGDA